MSFENVKAFYNRIASDETFRNRLQAATSDEEYSQVVIDAGYEFTQEEFEDYTTQLLEANAAESELKDLSEKELQAVFGGFFSNYIVQPLYGVTRPIWPFPYPSPTFPKPIQPQPLYGIVTSL